VTTKLANDLPYQELLSTDTNKIEFQDIRSKDKKDLVRQFSDKWNQEETYNSLALGVAVAANGSDGLLR
jgi:hypothetical protein